MLETRPQEAFRDFRADARPIVKEFYRLNHAQQTLDFVLAKKREFLPRKRRLMDVWEALRYLDTLVDDSDPDIELSQIQHLLQTAEAIPADAHPRCSVLTVLIHDLAKLLSPSAQP